MVAGGFTGGSAPNEEGDDPAYYLPEEERQNPRQVLGRHPDGIRKGLGKVGPVCPALSSRERVNWRSPRGHGGGRISAFTEVTVPPDSTATIGFPSGREPGTVAGETHRFTLDLQEVAVAD